MPSKAIVSEVKVLACSIGWRNYHFLKITTEDGIVGWSEFDESFGSPAVSAVIGEIQHRVIGQSAMHHEHVYQDLYAVTRPGSGGVVGQALAAIENALLDVKAKALDVPCHVILGGKVRDKIRVYWSHFVSYRTRTQFFEPEAGIFDVGGVRKITREVGEKGFTAIKTNIFHYDEKDRIKGWSPGFGAPHEPARNVERDTLQNVRRHLELVREGVGPDVDILLDLNFNSRTEGYLKILRAIEDMDLFWVEIDMLDAEALAYIRSQSRIPISSCETLIGLRQFLPYFRNQSIDVAIIDTPWNGVWQSLKIAAAAEAFEINVAAHNFYGHLSTMINGHFSAVVPNMRIMETDIDRMAWDDELFTHAPHYEDGYLILADRPGWGTEPDEAALAAHPPLDTVGMFKRTESQKLSV